MALDGTFYLDSGRGRLYFDKHEGTFFFYHVEGRDKYLNKIFLALPRLPLAYAKNLTWSDYIPIGVASSGVKKEIFRFLSSFYPDFARVDCLLAYKDAGVIQGVARSNTLNIEIKTCVELDERAGFKTIKVNNLELRRIENENVAD
jgi:hypothetical protein